jgi:hypothetical protein
VPRLYERAVNRLATLLPLKLAVAPERVLINSACVLIGVAALAVVKPGSLLALWPAWVAYAWPATMAFGGAAALIGYWNNPRRRWANSLERTGYLAILLASVVYGVGLIVVFGWQGIFSALLFFCIAFAKAVRLLVSSAARANVLKNGNHRDPS